MPIFLGLTTIVALLLTPGVQSTLMNLTGIDIVEIAKSIIGNFTSVIAQGLLNLFNELVYYLPISDGLPTQVIYAANQVTPFMNVVNLFFPFDTVLFLISILMVIQMTLWSWSIGTKLYGWARGYDSDNSKYNLFDNMPNHSSYTDRGSGVKVTKLPRR